MMLLQERLPAQPNQHDMAQAQVKRCTLLVMSQAMLRWCKALLDRVSLSKPCTLCRIS